MGTGASLQTSEISASVARGEVSEKQLAKGPLPINGKPYVFYPAHCSASIRQNNLSNFEDTMVFSCKHKVIFVEMGEERLKSSVFRSDAVIHQTRACTITGSNKQPLRIIAVAQDSGLVLWDFDQQKRILKHSFTGSEFSEKTVPFMRGIAVSEHHVLVGTSTGEPALNCRCGWLVRQLVECLLLGRVLFFSETGEIDTTLNVSEHPVSDIAFYKSADEAQNVVVATTDGSIVVWSGSTKIQKDFILQKPLPSIATSLGIVGPTSLVVAAFTSGHIRVYSSARKEIVAQIDAHARPISSLCVSSKRPQVVSSGEDSVLNVWTISEDKISLDFSQKITNTLVVGSTFIGKNDEAVGATAYDYEGVFVWTLPPEVIGLEKQ